MTRTVPPRADRTITSRESTRGRHPEAEETWAGKRRRDDLEDLFGFCETPEKMLTQILRFMDLLAGAWRRHCVHLGACGVRSSCSDSGAATRSCSWRGGIGFPSRFPWPSPRSCVPGDWRADRHARRRAFATRRVALESQRASRLNVHPGESVSTLARSLPNPSDSDQSPPR